MLTLAEVKLQLGITDSSKDSLLNQLIAQAVAHAERETQRSFSVRTIVEFYHGTGTSELVLRQTPIVSVDEVRLDEEGHFGQADGSFATGTVLAEGVDYAVDGSILRRIGCWWPIRNASRFGQLSSQQIPSHGSIKVTYQAGFASMPADIKDACIQIIARRLESPTGREVASKSMDYVSVSYAGSSTRSDVSNAAPTIESIFRAYRKPRF